MAIDRDTAYGAFEWGWEDAIHGAKPSVYRPDGSFEDTAYWAGYDAADENRKVVSTFGEWFSDYMEGKV